MSTDGTLLSDKASVMARWQDHFTNLLNWPLHPNYNIIELALLELAEYRDDSLWRDAVTEWF